MTDLKLRHIGEPLVARMLKKLEAAGRPSNLVCELTHVSVEEDVAAGRLEKPIEFLPEKASLDVLANGGRVIQ